MGGVCTEQGGTDLGMSRPIESIFQPPHKVWHLFLPAILHMLALPGLEEPQTAPQAHTFTPSTPCLLSSFSIYQHHKLQNEPDRLLHLDFDIAVF